MRLVGSNGRGWDSRGHFFMAAVEAMRRILVDNARRKQSLKRGGRYRRISVEDADPVSHDDQDDILALAEALDKLVQHRPKAAEVVKLRYFAGLKLQQIAEILNVSRRTVDSYWAYAQAWLYREMSGIDTARS